MNIPIYKHSANGRRMTGMPLGKYIAHQVTCDVTSDQVTLLPVRWRHYLWAPAQRKRATMLYFANVFFLWPPYSPALVNGGSRKFYTWWILSVIREVISWIFSWSPLNYRVGQKVTKFGVFSDRTRKLSALTPECSRIL